MKFKFKNYQLNKNKFILCTIFILFSIMCLCLNSIDVLAETTNNSDVTQQLSSSINQLLNGLDLSSLEEFVASLDTFNFFETNVIDKIKSILSGEYFTDYASIFSSILSLFFITFKDFIPFLFTLLAIGILSNIIVEFKSNEGTADMVHFVCFSVMIIIILYIFKDILSLTSATLASILKQMQMIFPILIAMLTSIGSFSTISIYNPLVAVLTTIVSVVFDKLLYPIFIIIFIFTILGSLTSTVKLDKLQGFLSSSFKWIVGLVFTLFTGFLSIQGISAGKYDSVSIKATKFAIKSYIPIIGSYISDGMDFLVLGSVLVKNTIGLVGVLILFISIITPILNMLIVKLGLQLTAGILEMTDSSKSSNFLSKCSNLLIYPIVLILGVAFMYVITISLIMCTANIF